MEWEGIEQVKNGLNSADRVKKVFKEKVSVGASGCQGFFEWWRKPFLWTEIVLCYQWASRVLYLCDYRGTGRTLLVWKNGVGVGGKVKKDETPIYFSTSDFKNASLLTMKNKYSYLQTTWSSLVQSLWSCANIWSI